MTYHAHQLTDKQTIAQLLAQAIAAYVAKYGRTPREILVSAEDSALAFAGVVTVRGDLIRNGMLGLVI